MSNTDRMPMPFPPETATNAGTPSIAASAPPLRPAEDPAPATICVFLGPSLPIAEARRLLPAASFYPPARMGDVYALIGRGVRSIGLIDGVFHGLPSIWQRELLAAIDAGIRVVGASSMGALRAAELHQFGMEGVGQVFAWYRDGVIEADDAVALLHHPEPPYTAFSEPLVNVRHLLETAVAAGRLAADVAARMLDWFASQDYPDRHLMTLIRAAPALGISAAEIATLRALAAALPGDAIKARDARALLARIVTPQPTVAPRWPVPPRSLWQIDGYGVEDWMRRCVVVNGKPRRLHTLLPLLDSAHGQQVIAAVRRRFYARQQLERLRAPSPPAEFVTRYRAAYAVQHGREAHAGDCAALPLSAWEAEVDQLAALGWWLVAELPAHRRVDAQWLAALAARCAGEQLGPFNSALPDVLLPGNAAERLARIRLGEACLLADWCDAAGLDEPAGDAAGVAADAALPAALAQLLMQADWLAAINPVELGYAVSWNDGSEALRHLATANALNALLDATGGAVA